MQGQLCRIYVHESDRHDGKPLWEWLLETANRGGIRGGSAFKAMAGFGTHHVVHESRFFELAGALSIAVEFIVTEEEARRLFEVLKTEGVRAFYVLLPAQFGVIEPGPGEG